MIIIALSIWRRRRSTGITRVNRDGFPGRFARPRIEPDRMDRYRTNPRYRLPPPVFPRDDHRRLIGNAIGQGSRVCFYIIDTQNPTIRFRVRLMLNRQRTQLSNATRAHMSEFGIVAPVGRIGLERLLAIVADKDDERIPPDARLCLEMLGVQLAIVKEQILENDRRIRASARDTEVGRRLMEIPGIGPLLASAFVASVADPRLFKTGRDLAAWIGLVPRQNSSGGKERLCGISRAGNQYLRQMLVVGSMAVIRHAERHGTKRPWLIELMKRRAKKVAAVALANKTARMVWALMTSGEHYREPQVAHA
ncbi:MAG: IS110 family transposase [Sphingomonadales bacterium]|nr:IS110 family transposase [Sphingomonadales bacterium]